MSVRVVTEPLGGSPLSQAVQRCMLPPEWHPPRPDSVARWTERLVAIREEFRARDWYDALAPAFGMPHGQAGTDATTRLERVARTGGVVVTTGQQPGLFGGPVYTWSKAVSVLALADALESATGIPVAPVYWAATDDADFAEASWTHVPHAGGFEILRLPPVPGAGELPLSELPLGDCGELLAVLARGAGSAASADVLDQVRGAYAPRQTVGGAFLALARALLEPLGIAVLDASHEAVRAAGFPVMQRALDRAPEVERALRQRDEAIVQAGYRPQVDAVPGRALVFARSGDGGRKERLPVAAATAAAARATPGSLLPNVLLRPIVERTILPTAAYAAGPGELAYFAQASAAAAALGTPAPLALPRWSGTILESHIEKLLARYGLEPADLADPHAAETALARAALPASARERLAELRTSADRAAALGQDGDELLPAAVLEGFRRHLHHRIDRLERRYLAAAKRREEAALRDLATLRGALYPGGKRQERAANLVPFLARHGDAIWDAMAAEARAHAAALLGITRTVRAARPPARATRRR